MRKRYTEEVAIKRGLTSRSRRYEGHADLSPVPTGRSRHTGLTRSASSSHCICSWVWLTSSAESTPGRRLWCNGRFTRRDDGRAGSPSTNRNPRSTRSCKRTPSAAAWAWAFLNNSSEISMVVRIASFSPPTLPFRSAAGTAPPPHHADGRPHRTRGFCP
jgi:hypothetical protein